MVERLDRPSDKPRKPFLNGIGAEEERKMRGRAGAGRRALIGFAYFGMIGWSVALPILAGTALGLWLDRRGHGHGWALSLLLAGVVLGCWNAWRMVSREARRIDGRKHGNA